MCRMRLLYTMEVKNWLKNQKLEYRSIIKIFNYVQNYVDRKISREAFWSLAKFKHPTHQISFHTDRALSTLHFLKGSEVYDEE